MTEKERPETGQEMRCSSARRWELLLLYVALSVIAVFFVLLLAAIVWHDAANLWLPEALKGTVLLWLLATVLLGAILMSVLSRYLQNRWLWWLSVVVAIAVTVMISLILVLLWLLRDT